MNVLPPYFESYSHSAPPLVQPQRYYCNDYGCKPVVAY